MEATFLHMCFLQPVITVRNHTLRAGSFLMVVMALSSCATMPAQQPSEAGFAAAASVISADDLLRNISTLASDEFEGRSPGSRGEELTVRFLTEEFQRLGLKPGNPDGTFVQNVPLIGFTTETETAFRFGDRTMEPRNLEDIVAISRRFVPELRIDDSELVFVGYGVVAPEFGWDDYKGLDVRGKTVVMLINDPPVPLASDPSRLDPEFFRGEAMTYYGRWTYKYEIASEKGAAAVLIVHETGPAGYPFSVVTGSWGRENFDIRPAGGNQDRVAVEGWISRDHAIALFDAGGHNFETLKASARTREFRPVSLNGQASFRVRSQVRETPSRNVIALLEGSDPTLRNEYIIYTAHWDHLGVDPSLEGDQIFNGAVDNATGTAGLIEVARAFRALPEPPRRTILFLAVTAEERGLLGAKHYAQNPLYPLEQTLANINMDGMNQWGRTRDIVVVGSGNSSLEDVLAETAGRQHRVLVDDPEPEKGFFYRSDHFEFAKMGVPALYIDSGVDFIGRPAGYGEQKRREYTENDYHSTSDEVKPDWDLSGLVEDLQLLFDVGYRVAATDRWPEWYPGTEFRGVREQSLRRGAR
ncbi:M28 family metallopeptidase [soil metagenome]